MMINTECERVFLRKERERKVHATLLLLRAVREGGAGKVVSATWGLMVRTDDSICSCVAQEGRLTSSLSPCLLL